MLKLLTNEEKQDLLKHAENLWRTLEENDLGGFSGINRPFWIVGVFREIIEEFGNRDTGLNWSNDDIEKLSHDAERVASASAKCAMSVVLSCRRLLGTAAGARTSARGLDRELLRSVRRP